MLARDRIRKRFFSPTESTTYMVAAVIPPIIAPYGSCGVSDYCSCHAANQAAGNRGTPATNDSTTIAVPEIGQKPWRAEAEKYRNASGNYGPDRRGKSVTAILTDTELCQSILFSLAFLVVHHAQHIVQYRLVSGGNSGGKIWSSKTPMPRDGAVQSDSRESNIHVQSDEPR